MKEQFTGIVLVAASMMGACATSASGAGDLADDPRRGDVVETVCFFGRLAGFYELSERALVIRRAPGDAYLVETGFCPNLKSLEGIRLNGAGNCLSRGDRLSVFNTPFPRQDTWSADRAELCLVASIHKWSEAEAPAENE